jgi:hypothetical protein
VLACPVALLCGCDAITCDDDVMRCDVARHAMMLAAMMMVVVFV